MTSPYLERPRRELGQALKDCGLNRSDFGFHPQNAKHHSRQSNAWTPSGVSNKANAGSTKWILAAFAFLLVSAAVVVATTTPSQQVAQEPNPEDVINIAPAAGGPQ